MVPKRKGLKEKLYNQELQSKRTYVIMRTMLVICPSRKTHGGRRRRRRRRKRHDCKHFLGVHQLGGNKPPEEQSTHDAPTPLVKGVDNQASQINLLRLKHHPKILLRLNFSVVPRHDCNQLYHTQRCKLGDIFFFFLFLLPLSSSSSSSASSDSREKMATCGTFLSFPPKVPKLRSPGFGVVEVAPVGGSSAKTGMRMDGWMDGWMGSGWIDGWMLLVGQNNTHHLKAQNSKTLKKEGRKEGM